MILSINLKLQEHSKKVPGNTVHIYMVVSLAAKGLRDSIATKLLVSG